MKSWIQRRYSITCGLPLYTVEKLFSKGTNLSCLCLNKLQVRCLVDKGQLLTCGLTFKQHDFLYLPQCEANALSFNRLDTGQESRG